MKRVLALAFLVLLLIPAAAHAGVVPVRIVEDERVITNGTPQQRQLALSQAADAGINTVRIVSKRESELAHVRETAQLADRMGFRVMLSISIFEGQNTPQSYPAGYARYAGFMARNLAPWVDYYSIINEPDQALRGGISRRSCGVQYQLVKKRVKYKRYIRFRRVKVSPGLKLYRRIKVKAKHKQRGPRMMKAGKYRVKYKVRTKRKHGKRFRMVRRKLLLYRPRLYREKFKGCRIQNPAEIYRKLFKAGYPQVKANDPGSPVLIGDTSPVGWKFINRLFCMTPGTVGDCSPLPADGYAHHPYEWNYDPDTPPEKISGSGLTDCETLKTLIKSGNRIPLPIWYTEFGYVRYGRPEWKPVTNDKVARYLPKAWAAAKRCGAKAMTQYHWWGNERQPWDSGIMSQNGVPDEGYWSLRKYLTGRTDR